ncbi:MAG: CbtA family protein [Gammaproteobacteria bacterium]|nr:CbtA family protein [Gammaproteobacteria bacterium]
MLNLATFRRIVSAALWTGILAGLLLTAVQSIQVIPTLLKAEVYEEKAAAAALSGYTHSSVEDGHEHQHDQDAWKPANGWERTFSTAVSNISLAVGFALLLGGAICFRGGVSSWRAGLLWGLAGYAVFFVAPSLGLPPEVPGTELARLADRQLWWLMTVLATGAGLSLLIFARTGISKILGVVLLVVPHLIGVPQPQIHSSAAPVGLAHAFIYATALANAVFWLAMGGLMGLFYKKWRNSKSE